MPDLRQLESVVSPEVLSAMKEASARLMDIGVPHALVGGLAVSAWSRPRWTKDVDFILDESAFNISPSGVVSFKEGVPLQVRDVPVDPILPKEGERHLFEAIKHAIISEGVPVIPVEALVYMKLAAGRSRDMGDVVEIIRAGADVALLRDYLHRYAPKLLDKLEQAVKEAEK